MFEFAQYKANQKIFYIFTAKLIFHMNTLYIHGLNSYPVPEKTEIMKKAGLSVVALHINYREKLGVYETLKDRIVRKNIKFIVGSSLGGYLGHWLAEDMGLPCLLFNPAMEYTDVFYSKIPIIEESKCPARFLVFGSKDDTIDGQKAFGFFKAREKDIPYQRIITCDWLGHKIDLNTFGGMVNWAVNSLQNIDK